MRWAVYRRQIAMVVAGGALAACAEVTAPIGGTRQVGILQLEAYTGNFPVPQTSRSNDETVHWDSAPQNETIVTPPRVIAMPDTVEAGTPFELTVYTIGANGCWRADGQNVKISARTVELTPFDVHSGADVCTTILAYLPHPTTITLDEPGEWTVRVSGRKARHGDAVWQTPVVAEKMILVR